MGQQILQVKNIWLFEWDVLLEKSALTLLGFLNFYYYLLFFYLLLSFLKVGFNDLIPGISFAPDLSQGAILHYSPLPFGTSFTVK